MSTVTDYSCSIVALGDEEFFREVAAPFAGSLQKLVPPYTGELPRPLRGSQSFQNGPMTVVLVGFTIFVASHLTKRVLDDIYSTIIQPRLKPLLETTNLKLRQIRTQKSFNASFWYGEHNVLVSVTVVGNSFAEILKQIDLIPTVHTNALAWIIANGIQKPIHHYKIEDGKVNAEPVLAEHVKEVLR